MHSRFPFDQERRENPDLGAIWKLLHEIKEQQEIHLAQDIELQPKLLELINLLERSKGAITLIKWTAYIGSFVAAIVLWAKDHIKL